MKRTSALAAIAGLIAATPASPAAETPRVPAGEETLQLGAFEVLADSDHSYGAVNSNSLTRFQISLAEMPATADVFTETFMKDVGATSVEDSDGVARPVTRPVVAVCVCGKTQRDPWCDGTHKVLRAR